MVTPSLAERISRSPSIFEQAREEPRVLSNLESARADPRHGSWESVVYCCDGSGIGALRHDALHRGAIMSDLGLGTIGQISRFVRDRRQAERGPGELLGLQYRCTFGNLACFDCDSMRPMLSQEDINRPSDSILDFRVKTWGRTPVMGRPLAVVAQINS
jgi:hypothetical protein